MLSNLPLPFDVESKTILKKATTAHKSLAELKGIVETLPNKSLIINSLVLREAKDSSEIENIITTNDELYKADINIAAHNSATKEVENYKQALYKGHQLVENKKVITANTIIAIQEVLENNTQGIRKTPGTVIQNTKTMEVVHRPPQNYDDIMSYMKNLENYINDNELDDYDPLVKMAIIHYQFESIHPFADGNGRTGRIINILYLLLNNLLDTPILYLSSYIIKNKNKYYKLLQELNDKNNTLIEESWEKWILFMLDGIEETSKESIKLIKEITEAMISYTEFINYNKLNIPTKDVVDVIFKHPYTKTEFLVEELGIQRQTAARYLDKLVDINLLHKQKFKNKNFYINVKLWKILSD